MGQAGARLWICQSGQESACQRYVRLLGSLFAQGRILPAKQLANTALRTYYLAYLQLAAQWIELADWKPCFESSRGGEKSFVKSNLKSTTSLYI
jgi:hypothetical protein